MTVTWRTVAIAAGIGLVLGGAGGYLLRQQSTTHRVESEAKKTDRAASLDVAAMNRKNTRSA